MLLGLVIPVVLILSGLVLRRPDADTVLPTAKVKGTAKKDAIAKDFTTIEMLKSMTFWRAFVCLSCITAAGNSVISFAKDLALSVDATPALATTLVGVLAVCNGLGRIITGAVYDVIGRRATMISANILTIAAAGITLIAVDEYLIPYGLLVMVVGPIVAWVSSWFLYGFGELIDKASDIERNTRGGERKSEAQAKVDSERISKIEKLRSQGLITEEEYQNILHFLYS